MPDASDHRATRPWLLTVLMFIVFVLPGAVIAFVASLSDKPVGSLICLAWMSIGIWVLFRRWERWARDSSALFAIELAKFSTPRILVEMERSDLALEEAAELLEFLNQYRPGWSSTVALLENAKDTQGPLAPLP